jgi:hypothetical protein
MPAVFYLVGRTSPLGKYVTIRCGREYPSTGGYVSNYWDLLPTDIYDHVEVVSAYNRDDALVAYGIAKQRRFEVAYGIAKQRRYENEMGR